MRQSFEAQWDQPQVVAGASTIRMLGVGEHLGEQMNIS